jgi:hypothetical protein
MRSRNVIMIAFAAMLVALLQCQAQYRPLHAAEGCACKPSEYCKVSAPSPTAHAELACLPLPRACGNHPTCDCIGERTDACRDEDGRLTLLPPRTVSACDACSAEEYCTENGVGGATCRVLPPQCDATPSCACFMEAPSRANRFACVERRGRVVARLLSPH